MTHTFLLKSKPITMRQVALESALNPDSRSPSPEPLPHVEEQRALRDETIAAFRNAADEDDDDGLLIPREKSKDEQEREEEEYRAFLEREVGGDLRGLVTVDANDVKEEEGESGDEGAKKKKKKKKTKDGKASKETTSGKSRQEDDQEFLMKWIRSYISQFVN
jgi:protein KRI1